MSDCYLCPCQWKCIWSWQCGGPAPPAARCDPWCGSSEEPTCPALGPLQPDTQTNKQEDRLHQHIALLKLLVEFHFSHQGAKSAAFAIAKDLNNSCMFWYTWCHVPSLNEQSVCVWQIHVDQVLFEMIKSVYCQHFSHKVQDTVLLCGYSTLNMTLISSPSGSALTRASLRGTALELKKEQVYTHTNT